MELVDIFNKNGGFFRTRDLSSRNQWVELKVMLEKGAVLKLKRGLYCLQQFSVTGQDTEVARIVPSGVFCLYSAWQHYGLINNKPIKYHVAVDDADNIVLPDYPPIKLYPWSEKYYRLGVVETAEGIKVYDLEKSVCDAMRFRNKVGPDLAIAVIENYLRRKDRNFDKLAKYARLMRMEHVMQEMTKNYELHT